MDGEDGGVHAFDAGAHLVELPDQVADFRLHGGVAQHGGADGQGRGHDDVLRGPDAHLVEGMVDGPQAPGGDLGFHVALVDLDHGPHALQGLQVEVHGAGADGAAARQGDRGLAEPGQERPQHQDGGPHGLHQLVGRLERAAFHAQGAQGGGKLVTGFVLLGLGVAAQGLEDLDHGADVRYRREMPEGHRFCAQQGRRDAGQGGVLGPRNRDAARKGDPSLYDQPIHLYSNPNTSA